MWQRYEDVLHEHSLHEVRKISFALHSNLMMVANILTNNMSHLDAALVNRDKDAVANMY